MTLVTQIKMGPLNSSMAAVVPESSNVVVVLKWNLWKAVT